MIQLTIDGWYPIETAPLDCTYVELELKDGSVVVGHWAQDLSGEYQPPFSGWFVEVPGCKYFKQVYPRPVAWRPIK